MTLAARRPVNGLDDTQLRSRVISPDEFHADTEAFVDVRLPRSQGKASYSMIGPGVSQNAGQKINLVEPHGFNIGAASMPHGVVNNPHLHFTAEVFLCTRGSFEMAVGRHGEQKLVMNAGDVFAVPTWVFRGFTNIGDDDGWLFTVLGGDDTGGIIWAPEILRAAAETGLYLTSDWELVDATLEGGSVPSDVLEPLADDELVVDQWSDDDLEGRVVRHDDLTWRPGALLGGLAAGVRLAPVIGPGWSELRRHPSPITEPMGFSLDWIELAPGASIGAHLTDVPQVWFPDGGDIVVESLDDDGHVCGTSIAVDGSVVSIPSGTWRRVRNDSDAAVRMMVVHGGDARPDTTWHADVVTAATADGVAKDANGRLAPAALLGEASS